MSPDETVRHLALHHGVTEDEIHAVMAVHPSNYHPAFKPKAPHLRLVPTNSQLDRELL